MVGGDPGVGNLQISSGGKFADGLGERVDVACPTVREVGRRRVGKAVGLRSDKAAAQAGQPSPTRSLAVPQSSSSCCGPGGDGPRRLRACSRGLEQPRCRSIARWFAVGTAVVLLAGPVFHEGVTLRRATLHSVDWLIKQVAIGAVIGLCH